MTQQEASALLKILNSVKETSKFQVVENNINEQLNGFALWKPYKVNLGAFKICKLMTKEKLWIVVCNWNPKRGYYIVVYPKKPGDRVLLEIKDLNDGFLKWSYAPRIQHGQNEARKEYFSRYYGSTKVLIPFPETINDLDEFFEELFYIATLRTKADVLEIEELPPERDTFPEGKKIQRIHERRERNSSLISRVKQEFKQNNNGRLFCQVCGFNFEEKYGERGKDFIEAHHTIPLSELNDDGGETDPNDIVLVCANCHRMIHRTRPWLTMDEILNMINESTAKTPSH